MFSQPGRKDSCGLPQWYEVSSLAQHTDKDADAHRRKGMRTETSIIAETAQCFSTHHVALLVGYGAHAICPYLAFETCRQWRSSSR